MAYRNLPEEIKMEILEYSSVPRTTAVTLQNDPAYLLQELLVLEPKLDLADLVAQAQIRNRRRRQLQLETTPEWDVWLLLQQYPDPFSIYEFDESTKFEIDASPRVLSALEQMGYTFEQKEHLTIIDANVNFAKNLNLIDSLYLPRFVFLDETVKYMRYIKYIK